MITKPQINCRYLQLTLPVTLFTILLCIFSYTASAVEFIQLEREFSGKGSSEGAFSKDIHLAFKTNIYVSDTENRLIQKLSPTGAFLLQIPTNPESPDNILRKPGHLTVDDLGNIYGQLDIFFRGFKSHLADIHGFVDSFNLVLNRSNCR